MIRLEYFNGKEWSLCQEFYCEFSAWGSLGGDDFNYRTVCSETGRVFTDKSNHKESK